MPVYPSIGNHDAGESPRTATIARRSRTTSTSASGSPARRRPGRASFGPGLFYRFRYGSDIEFVCIDTSKESFFKGHRLFELPKHWAFVDGVVPGDAGRRRCGGSRSRTIRRTAPDRSITTRKAMARLSSAVRSRRREGDVQRARAQLPALAGRTASTTSSPARPGSSASGRPIASRQAHTQSWSSSCHFLLVEIDGDRMVVRAIGELGAAGALADIPRLDPSGAPVTQPMVIRLS